MRIVVPGMHARTSAEDARLIRTLAATHAHTHTLTHAEECRFRQDDGGAEENLLFPATAPNFTNFTYRAGMQVLDRSVANGMSTLLA